METVGVVGLGTVGAAVAAAFEDAGVRVRGFDRYQQHGSASDMAGCDAVFVCVPTPADEQGYDASEVWNAVEALAPQVAPGTVVAIKSTVPPGTTDHLALTYPRFDIASVPEFLQARRPAETLRVPDRVIIGARSHAAGALLTRLMNLVAPAAPVLLVAPIEAELIKLCSNVLLAAKIAMANELAAVCATFGAAWPRVQSGVGLDRRIGPDHLTVTGEGGFSGGCLPKDLDGLIGEARASGYRPRLLEEIAEFNRSVRRDLVPEGAS